MKEDKNRNNLYPGFVDSFQHLWASGSVTSFGVAQCELGICDEPKWKLHRRKISNKNFFLILIFLMFRVHSRHKE